LADFLIAELTDARWSAEAVMGWKSPARRGAPERLKK
jgi:hypothetical protein